MSDIFISYASEDRNKAEKLAAALQSQGWSVWWDRAIPAGSQFVEVIDKAIADARCVVVLWSEASVAKNWVLEEAQDGLDRGILVPVLIDGVTPPRGFRRIQAANLSDWDGSVTAPQFQHLVRDMVGVLGALPAPGSLETKVPAQPDEVRRYSETTLTRDREDTADPKLIARAALRRKHALVAISAVFVFTAGALIWTYLARDAEVVREPEAASAARRTAEERANARQSTEALQPPARERPAPVDPPAIRLGMVLEAQETGSAKTPGKGSQRGVLVREVWAGSVAERSGIYAGDVIVSADGRPIDHAEFLRLLGSLPAGKVVSLIIYRSSGNISGVFAVRLEIPGGEATPIRNIR